MWKEIFYPQGPLSACGFGFRQTQVDMVEAIESLFAGSYKTLVAESPCGTGKSAAYLVPAISMSENVRTLVATSNKVLQDQIVNKDIPAISAALGKRVPCSVLKGFQSYACLHQASKRKGYKNAPYAKAEIEKWLLSTGTGDRAVAPEVADCFWSEISTDSDNCDRERCGYIGSCFVFKARDRAKESRIVVANHHLLLVDHLVRSRGGKGLLPDFQFLVIDEADRLVEAARSVFGARVSRYASIGLANYISERIRDVDLSGFMSASEEFWEDVEKYVNGRDYKTRFKTSGWVDFSDFAGAADKVSGRISQKLEDLGVDESGAGWSLLNTEEQMFASSCANSVRRLRGLVETVSDLVRLSDDANSVYFAEKMRKGDFALVKEKIRLPEHLAPVLTAQRTLLTSATITPDGDFAGFMSELGIPDAKCVRVGTTFDYPSQARLVLQNLGDVSKPEFATRLADLVDGVARKLGGRTMVLFTSWRSLLAVEDLLREGDPPYRLLVQRDGTPVAKLVEEMRSDPEHGCVLLGTSSFWKGVDLPGDALQALVVEKFPFPTPDDPVFDWYEAHEKDVFKRRMMPEMMLSLKQGVGRLIRTKDDVGFVVLCDNRADPRSGKFYGKRALSALPQMPVLRSVEDGISFIASKGRVRGAPA